MDTPFNTQDNDVSDYDSDFSPDEQGILDELLSKIPNTYTTAPPLVIENTNSHERPPGNFTHRLLGHENPKRTDNASSDARKNVQMWALVKVNGDEVPEATGGQ